jgi:hypothetical protein
MDSEHRQITEVIRNVLEEATDKSADEVRSMLARELRLRGIEPSSEAIEAYRATIAEKLSSPDRGVSFPAATRRGHRSHSLISANPARMIRNAKAMRSILPQYQQSRRISFMEPDHTQIPLKIIMDATTRHWLATGQAKLPKGAQPARRIDVWLDFGDGPAGARSIRVHLRDSLIGYLRPEDSAVFATAIESSAIAKETLMTSGYMRSERGADGLEFYVYRPLTGLT